MAGDPAAAILLMAMGFDSLSMNATNLPKVRWMLRQVSLSRADGSMLLIVPEECRANPRVWQYLQGLLAAGGQCVD